MLATVAIVGHGLIGGSVALALRSRASGIDIITVDRDDPVDAAARADLIILSAPIRANIANLRALRPLIAPATLITDTGSTKSSILGEAGGLRFIGGHPIAGAAFSGHEAAREDLFVGQTWILTPSEAASREDVAIVRTFVELLGAKPVVLPADEHDRLFAYVSHLPQLTISALMHVVGEAAGRDGLAFAGPGLRDSSRLASSHADIWRDIAADNRPNVIAALDALIGVLQTLRNDVSGEDLSRIFESARRSRALLDSPDH